MSRDSDLEFIDPRLQLKEQILKEQIIALARTAREVQPEMFSILMIVAAAMDCCHTLELLEVMEPFRQAEIERLRLEIEYHAMKMAILNFHK